MDKEVSRFKLDDKAGLKLVVVFILVIVLIVIIALKVEINYQTINLIPTKLLPSKPVIVVGPHETMIGTVYGIVNPNKHRVLVEINLICYGDFQTTVLTNQAYILAESTMNYNVGSINNIIKEKCPKGTTNVGLNASIAKK